METTVRPQWCQLCSNLTIGLAGSWVQIRCMILDKELGRIYGTAAEIWPIQPPENCPLARKEPAKQE